MHNIRSREADAGAILRYNSHSIPVNDLNNSLKLYRTRYMESPFSI